MLIKISQSVLACLSRTLQMYIGAKGKKTTNSLANKDDSEIFILR